MPHPHGHMKMSEIDNLPEAEKVEILGTEYDETIRSLLSALSVIGYGSEEFAKDTEYVHALLAQTQDYQAADPTLDEALPFIYLHDLVVAGVLAHRWAESREAVLASMYAQLGEPHSEGEPS